MKLFVFIPSFSGGGAERVMIRVAGQMADRGHEVFLVVASSSGELAPVVSPKVSVLDLKAGRLFNSISALAREIREKKPETLLSAMTATNCVAGLALKISGQKVRHIMSERNFASANPVKGKVNRIAIPVLKRALYPRANRIVTVSKEVAEDLGRSIPKCSHLTQAIYNPIPRVSDDPGECSHPWLSKEAGVPVFLAAGRLNEQKDYPTLLKAFSKVRKSQACRLIILGEGGLRDSLVAMTEDLSISDDVDFPGFVDNAQDWMRRASVFVMSSRYEGMPNAMLEALALGVPVVSTSCPGGPIEVLEGGKHGLLAPVQDADALAAAMVLQLTGNAELEGDGNLSRFDPEVIFSKYELVLLGE